MLNFVIHFGFSAAFCASENEGLNKNCVLAAFSTKSKHFVAILNVNRRTQILLLLANLETNKSSLVFQGTD